VRPFFTLSHSSTFHHLLITLNYIGGADKSIRLWSGKKCEREYHGHADVVRGIALITDIGFASCANSG
jgi:hypothetical protein